MRNLALLYLQIIHFLYTYLSFKCAVDLFPISVWKVLYHVHFCRKLIVLSLKLCYSPADFVQVFKAIGCKNLVQSFKRYFRMLYCRSFVWKENLGCVTSETITVQLVFLLADYERESQPTAWLYNYMKLYNLGLTFDMSFAIPCSTETTEAMKANAATLIIQLSWMFRTHKGLKDVCWKGIQVYDIVMCTPVKVLVVTVTDLEPNVANSVENLTSRPA